MHECPTPTQVALQARRMMMYHHALADSKPLHALAQRLNLADQLVPRCQRRLAQGVPVHHFARTQPARTQAD
jgi:hypothetical protein